MTCKDCIHYDVCEAHLKLNDIPLELCGLFKDKSRIVELPCKVGDTVYVLNQGNQPQKMILDAPDIRCRCSNEHNLCMSLCNDRKHNICAYRLINNGSDIGTKVFLTKKEAEKALKEKLK